MAKRMTPAVDRPPRSTSEQAEDLALRLFGVAARATELPSERDRNFLLTEAGGRKTVLKISNPGEARAVLELQNAAMSHLRSLPGPPLCPEPLPARDGRSIVEARDAAGADCALRLLSYIDGAPLALVKPRSPGLLSDLGRFAARLATGLSTFDHPAAKRDFPWDLRTGPATVRAYLELVAPADRRALVRHFLEWFERSAGPRLGSLASGVVHDDLNDYNIIVALLDAASGAPEDRRVAGVIDFGDMVHSFTLSELAVACAYALLGSEDPAAAAARVVAGYHAERGLDRVEIELLYPLIVMRLLLSAALCAYQAGLRPENRYLEISNAQVWEALERLRSLSPDLVTFMFRAACGLPASSGGPGVAAWLRSDERRFAFVLGEPLRAAKRAVIDWSVGSLLVENPRVAADPAALGAIVRGEMERCGAAVGVGRYDEARIVYASPAFRPAGRPLAEGRTVHLGTDLFVPAGSPVFSPLPGIVHSFRDNAARFDYGPTIVLEHRADTEEGPVPFFTLYGHLSADSIAGLRAGRAVARGERIGAVGAPPGNGDWPPHLHFQVVLDMLGRAGDFPGVARASERPVWLGLCPDPGPILGWTGEETGSGEAPPEDLLTDRRRLLGRNLSVSYRAPLKIVRGFLQHLFDHTGRVFLDGVNNVAHVGHNHPRVVDAVRRQAAVLDTNTRYLHDNLVRYARRLTSLLPEPLRVCYIVNSGSEANDLALRLARQYTKARDIVCVAGAYHGHLSSLIEISPYKFDGPGGASRPAHTRVAAMPDLYRGPFRSGDPAAGAEYARFVKAAVEEIVVEGRVAAFICESLLSCGGQIVLPEGYLRDAYGYVRAAGGLCIADEVQVGFGRTGETFWGFETQGVIPDIVTMGKPIGNGFPLAAVVTTPAVADAFATGMEYFNTYGGNPVACAAGLAVLDVLEEEGLQDNALRTGARLKAGIDRLKGDFQLVGDARGLGLFLGLELVLDREARSPAPRQAAYVVERLREEGILLSTDGPDHNVIKIKPPLVFSPADADLLLAALERVLAEDPAQP